jgi:putative transposase
MSLFRFQVGDFWTYKGQRLVFQRDLGDGLLHFMVETSGGPLQVADADGILHMPGDTWAMEAYAKGHLVRLPKLSGTRARLEAAKRDYDLDQIRKMDRQADLRAFVVRGLDRLGVGALSDKKLHLAIAKLWAAEPVRTLAFDRKPPVRTVRRWLKERGSYFDRKMAQMVSMSGRVPRAPRFPPETCELLRRFALKYWSPIALSKGDAYALFAGCIARINRRRDGLGSCLPQLKLPSKETFRKQVRRLECYETYAARHGEKKAKARFGPSGEGLVAERLLQLGCLDHTMVDGVLVMSCDQRLPMGRPWLTVLIDVRTRCVLGWVISFEPPSLYSATECVKRAATPKLSLLEGPLRYQSMAWIFGHMDEIVVDNGKDLSGIAFEDSMIELTTSVRWAPIASPTFKAIGERFFGTLNTMLFNKLPGATLKPEILREMGIDPQETAILTLEELECLIQEAICLYHYEEHSELNAPPAQVWMEQAKEHGVSGFDNLNTLDQMVGALRDGCRVARTGVKFQNLRYFDENAVGALLDDLAGLAPQRNQPKGSASFTAKIKYNPANLGQIHVWNARRNTYVTLPCLEPAYASGLSMFQHKFLTDWAKLKGRDFSSPEDRLAARAALSCLVAEFAPDLNARSRRVLARLRHSPIVHSLQGDTVSLAYAAARHDGLAPVIPHDTLSSFRADGGQPSSRPPRAASKKAKPAGKSKARAKVPSVAEGWQIGLPETGEEASFTLLPDLEWKGFGE